MDRRNFLKTAGLFSVATAGGVFLVGCSTGEENQAGGATPGTDTTPDASPVASAVFMTPFQHIMNYGDAYVAMNEGYFEDEGLRVEAVGGSGTATSVQQVVAGQAQYGKAAAVVTGPLIADEGADIITIARGDQKSQYSVASLPETPLLHPKDWQGKTIGVISLGGATELLLDAMSVAAGLDPANVNKVVTGADVSSLEFLNNGEVDGFITYVGSEVAIKNLGIELHYLNTDEFAPMPGDSYIVARSALAEHKEEMAAFLRACRRAFKFMEDPNNAEKVYEAVGVYNPTEVEDKDLAKMKLEAYMDLSKPANGDYLDMDMADWQIALDLMVKSGIIESANPSVEDFATTEVLDLI